MNKQQAIEAMRQGSKLTHPYFTKDEWITMRGGVIITEDGYSVNSETFWKDRNVPGWEEHWEIFDEVDLHNIKLYQTTDVLVKGYKIAHKSAKFKWNWIKLAKSGNIQASNKTEYSPSKFWNNLLTKAEKEFSEHWFIIED